MNEEGTKEDDEEEEEEEEEKGGRASVCLLIRGTGLEHSSPPSPNAVASH
jgi:hypothetical protein